MAFALNFILGVCVIYFIRWYLRRRTIINYLKKFNGPPPLPLIGNALEFAQKSKMLSNICNLDQKYGSIVKLWIGPTPSMLITQDSKFIQFLTTSPKTLAKAHEYGYLKEWIGEGIVSNNGGPRWVKHRKILNPAFYVNVLDTFIPVFTSVCNNLVKKLEKEVGNPSFEIGHILKLYTLDSICECAMGTSINALDNANCTFVSDVATVCEVLTIRTFNPFLKSDLLYRLSKHYRRATKSFKALNDKVNLVIHQRRDKMKNEENSTTGEDEYGKKSKLAFLDLMLKAAATDPSLTDEHIREEVATFMFAGHDTTQVALSFCLYSLAANQDIQEKVVKELHEIFDDDDKKRNVTLADTNRMKYMEAVIKEALRLYPSVPLIARTVSEDVDYDRTVIPKGTTLIINVFGLHRRPELYPDPSRFDPERFLTGTETKSAYTYIPFSVGPRDCIGRKFAMIEMKLTLANLLREFKFLPSVPEHHLEIANEVVLISHSGICVQLQKRNF